MTFGTDEKAQAHGIILFVAILVGSALFFVIADPAAGLIFDMSLNSTDSQLATDTINERKQIWGLVLYFIVFFALVFLIARSVVQSRRP